LNWKFLNASVLGTSHQKTDLPCQDECIIDSVKDAFGNEVLIAVVSDGAGSAKHANQASETTCSTLFTVLEKAITSVKEVSSFGSSGKRILFREPGNPRAKAISFL